MPTPFDNPPDPFDNPPDPNSAPTPPPTSPNGPAGGAAPAAVARWIAVSAAVAALGITTVIVIADDGDDDPADQFATGQPAGAGNVSGDDADAVAVSGATAESALLAQIEDDRSLDGTGNNVADPSVGAAGRPYPRETQAAYADGVDLIDTDRPDERYLSNRVFNDTNQNLFSENGVTHWGFVWGQFIDHTIGLAAGHDDTERVDLAFGTDDPLESFTNDLGSLSTSRSAVAAGTGVGTGTTAEQINTVSSYIDAWNVYGGTAERLDWLRDGVTDGDPTNNEATLLTVDGYLPTVLARSDVEAPHMDLMGRLFADPTQAIVAGDVRANENIALTAVHTLFVREHNRIVELLPGTLDEETKFAIARRVIAAMEQYITYEEFLPAMGVALDDYDGYDSDVDPSITNEFATVGYRAHSQIHGEFEAEIPAGEVDDELVANLTRHGVDVEIDGSTGDIEIAVPLNGAYGNPGLLVDIGLGNLAAGLSSEAAYANDEQIDNQLRSVLFQIPGPGTENPLDCLDGAEIASCFTTVNDLGALDVFRAYDHGIASYNDLREEYGLPRIESFTDLTGERTSVLPDGLTIDDPEIMEIVALFDADGDPIAAGTDEADTSAVAAVRRSTLAARLDAVFGSVDEVDAFTGMVSEPHVPGTEFGELQLAMWRRQFSALRDGDRFFHDNDPALDMIAELYGVDYRRTLADVIADNTAIDRSDLPTSAFLLDDNADIGADAVGNEDDSIDGDVVVAAPADDDADRPRRPRGRRRPGARVRDARG